MMKFFKTSLRALLFGAVLALCPMVCNAADGDKFKLVKSVSELNDGDKIIVAKTNFSLTELGVDGTCNAALSTDYKKDTNIKACEIDVSGDVATITDKIEVLEVEREDQIFYLKAITKNLYLYTNRTDSRYNKVTYTTRSKAKTHIEITDAYDAIIWYDRQNRTAGESMLAYSGEWKDWGKFQCYDLDAYRNNKDYSIKIFKQIIDQVSLSESTDNAAVISSNNGKTVDVSLSRTLVADKWNTFCVPFDIDLTDGKLNGVEVRVMEFMDVESNIMCFGTTTKIKAGEAYLIKPLNESITNPLLPNVTISNKEPMTSGKGNYSFVGVYSPKSFDEQASKVSLFINGSAKLSRPKVNSTMKGMRAYFACASEQAASAQLQLGGELTGVASIVSDVDEDGNIYNLNGVCIGKDIKGLSKGLYIKNGKKFVVK